MEDLRVKKFAQILVDYSTEVKPGDCVAIATTTIAEPLVRELYSQVLERGGHPHILMNLPDQEELLFQYANEEQLEFVPRFHKSAFEEFDVLIKVRAQSDPRGLSDVPPERQSIHQRGFVPEGHLRRRSMNFAEADAMTLRCCTTLARMTCSGGRERSIQARTEIVCRVATGWRKRIFSSPVTATWPWAKRQFVMALSSRSASTPPWSCCG